MHRKFKRIPALATCIAFILSNHFNHLPAAASVEAGNVSYSSSAQFPQDISQMQVPAKIGKIQEVYTPRPVSPSPFVILIQDAHGIPDAQRNIQKLIEFFQKEYGLRLIGVEGASSELDPQMFKSFPDKEILKKTFEEYFQKGELTGTTAAAIFTESSSLFHGIEDWGLYEEGLRFYLRAMKREQELTDKLQAARHKLQEEKEKVYSKELLDVDKTLEAFKRNDVDLVTVLKRLEPIRGQVGMGSFQPVPLSMAALFDEIKKGDTDQSAIEREVREIAERVKGYLESVQRTAYGVPRNNDLHLRSTQNAVLGTVNQKYQEFLTSQITPAAFALFLKEFLETVGAAPRGRPFVEGQAQGPAPTIKISDRLKRLIQHHKRLRDIEGTQFFRDFETYVKAIKESWLRNEEERRLDAESRKLELLEKLAKLELNREEWEEIREASFVKREATLGSHLAFYSNAEGREKAFLTNLEKLMAENASRDTLNASLFVAGGFHTEGLARQFKEKGISYIVIRPEMGSIPEHSPYRQQMQGNVSWKDYFQAENGQVNLYKAFVRGTRDKLLHEALSMKGDSRLLKEWRDQIIRDLATKEQLTKTHEYTQFLDEIIRNNTKYASRPHWLSKIDRFIAGLHRLENRGQLSEQNVLKLLKPAAAYGVPEINGQIAVGSNLTAVLRAEIRQEEPYQRGIENAENLKQLRSIQNEIVRNHSIKTASVKEKLLSDINKKRQWLRRSEIRSQGREKIADAYGDLYNRIRETSEGMSEITESDLKRTRSFLTPQGTLKNFEERRANGVFGISEVYFLPDSPTRQRMANFQKVLKERFKDKVYLVDEDKLHLTLQGLRELANHSGKEVINANEEPFASVNRRANKIQTPSVRMQVSKVNWNPSIGIFWEVQPSLDDPSNDPIIKRRKAWGLSQPRPPHITAAYLTQPFTAEELKDLKAFIAQYQSDDYFGDINVSEAQIIAYEDLSFNAGYRVLTTIPFRSNSRAEIREALSNKQSIFWDTKLRRGLAGAFESAQPLFMIRNLRDKTGKSQFDDRNVIFNLGHVRFQTIQTVSHIIQTFAEYTKLGSEIFQYNAPLARSGIFVTFLGWFSHSSISQAFNKIAGNLSQNQTDVNIKNIKYKNDKLLNRAEVRQRAISLKSGEHTILPGETVSFSDAGTRFVIFAQNLKGRRAWESKKMEFILRNQKLYVIQDTLTFQGKEWNQEEEGEKAQYYSIQVSNGKVSIMNKSPEFEIVIRPFRSEVRSELPKEFFDAVNTEYFWETQVNSKLKNLGFVYYLALVYLKKLQPRRRLMGIIPGPQIPEKEVVEQTLIQMYEAHEELRNESALPTTQKLIDSIWNYEKQRAEGDAKEARAILEQRQSARDRTQDWILNRDNQRRYLVDYIKQVLSSRSEVRMEEVDWIPNWVALHSVKGKPSEGSVTYIYQYTPQDDEGDARPAAFPKIYPLVRDLALKELEKAISQEANPVKLEIKNEIVAIKNFNTRLVVDPHEGQTDLERILPNGFLEITFELQPGRAEVRVTDPIPLELKGDPYEAAAVFQKTFADLEKENQESKISVYVQPENSQELAGWEELGLRPLLTQEKVAQHLSAPKNWADPQQITFEKGLESEGDYLKIPLKVSLRLTESVSLFEIQWMPGGSYKTWQELSNHFADKLDKIRRSPRENLFKAFQIEFIQHLADGNIALREEWRKKYAVLGILGRKQKEKFISTVSLLTDLEESKLARTILSEEEYQGLLINQKQDEQFERLRLLLDSFVALAKHQLSQSLDSVENGLKDNSALARKWAGKITEIEKNIESLTTHLFLVQVLTPKYTGTDQEALENTKSRLEKEASKLDQAIKALKIQIEKRSSEEIQVQLAAEEVRKVLNQTVYAEEKTQQLMITWGKSFGANIEFFDRQTLEQVPYQLDIQADRIHRVRLAKNMTYAELLHLTRELNQRLGRKRFYPDISELVSSLPVKGKKASALLDWVFNEKNEAIERAVDGISVLARRMEMEWEFSLYDHISRQLYGEKVSSDLLLEEINRYVDRLKNEVNKVDSEKFYPDAFALQKRIAAKKRGSESLLKDELEEMVSASDFHTKPIVQQLNEITLMTQLYRTRTAIPLQQSLFKELVGPFQKEGFESYIVSMRGHDSGLKTAGSAGIKSRPQETLLVRRKTPVVERYYIFHPLYGAFKEVLDPFKKKFSRAVALLKPGKQIPVKLGKSLGQEHVKLFSAFEIESDQVFVGEFRSVNYFLTWDALAKELSHSHQFDQALSAYQKAIVIEPQDRTIWFDLGTSYLLEADEMFISKNVTDRTKYLLAQAETAFLEAKRLIPDMPKLHNNLGSIYRFQAEIEGEKSVRFEQALAAYEKALLLLPGVNPVAFRNLVGVLFERNGFDAGKVFARIFNPDPKVPDLPQKVKLANIVLEQFKTPEGWNILADIYREAGYDAASDWIHKNVLISSKISMPFQRLETLFISLRELTRSEVRKEAVTEAKGGINENDAFPGNEDQRLIKPSSRVTRLERSGTATRRASSTAVRRSSTWPSRFLTSTISSRSGRTTSDTVLNSPLSSSIKTATARAVNLSSINHRGGTVANSAPVVNIKNKQYISIKNEYYGRSDLQAAATQVIYVALNNPVPQAQLKESARVVARVGVDTFVETLRSEVRRKMKELEVTQNEQPVQVTPEIAEMALNDFTNSLLKHVKGTVSFGIDREVNPAFVNTFRRLKSSLVDLERLWLSREMAKGLSPADLQGPIQFVGKWNQYRALDGRPMPVAVGGDGASVLDSYDYLFAVRGVGRMKGEVFFEELADAVDLLVAARLGSGDLIRKIADLENPAKRAEIRAALIREIFYNDPNIVADDGRGFSINRVALFKRIVAEFTARAEIRKSA